MKKTMQIVSGLLTLVFGMNFIAHAAKTDFQKKLEKAVTVTVLDSAVDSDCIGKCDQKKPR